LLLLLLDLSFCSHPLGGCSRLPYWGDLALFAGGYIRYHTNNMSRSDFISFGVGVCLSFYTSWPSGLWLRTGGTAAAVPPPFRHGEPALCGSIP